MTKTQKARAEVKQTIQEALVPIRTLKLPLDKIDEFLDLKGEFDYAAPPNKQSRQRRLWNYIMSIFPNEDINGKPWSFEIISLNEINIIELGQKKEPE